MILKNEIYIIFYIFYIFFFIFIYILYFYCKFFTRPFLKIKKNNIYLLILYMQEE